MTQFISLFSVSYTHLEIIEYALKCDVKLYDMDDYYMTENKKSNSIIIGYAGAEDDDIELLKSIFENFI